MSILSAFARRVDFSGRRSVLRSFLGAVTLPLGGKAGSATSSVAGSPPAPLIDDVDDNDEEPLGVTDDHLSNDEIHYALQIVEHWRSARDLVIDAFGSADESPEFLEKRRLACEMKDDPERFERDDYVSTEDVSSYANYMADVCGGLDSSVEGAIWENLYFAERSVVHVIEALDPDGYLDDDHPCSIVLDGWRYTEIPAPHEPQSRFNARLIVERVTEVDETTDESNVVMFEAI